ncbi:MAG: hypothetical protein ACREPM_25920 [Gemmatimonadaceae bacterium]
MYSIGYLIAAAFVASGPLAPTTSAHAHGARADESCVAPEHTGTFRVTASKVDGTQGVPALLLLENIDGCLEATFITDGSSPAAIDHLAKSGDAIEGRLNVTGFETQVTLRFDGATVAGSIVGKQQQWKLEGRKTS